MNKAYVCSKCKAIFFTNVVTVTTESAKNKRGRIAWGVTLCVPSVSKKKEREKRTAMSDRTRLTTDNPITNVMNMLNFAYIKNNKVYLRYGDGNATDLCDLCSDLATKQGCNLTPDEIMEGACFECDCEVNILYHLATQAAELRERLKHYEDLEEQGRLIVPPCKVGDTVYRVITMGTGVHSKCIQKKSKGCYYGVSVPCEETIKKFIRSVTVTRNNYFDVIENFGKTAFLSREEAEKALEKEL